MALGWSVSTAALRIVVWVFFPWNCLLVATAPFPDGSWRKIWHSKLGRKFFPYQNIGSEFMPPLYEGDLLYMPTTFPGISPTKARQVLQTTDRIIHTFPEVQNVFGKAGRAETATDPAPFDMIETTITLKPEEQWPAADILNDAGKIIAHRRRTPDELVDALNAAVQIPGLNNSWTMPIKTRIDMLATGIKTPVGIKIAGPDLAELERIAAEVETVVKTVPGTLSAFAERTMGGNYIEFHIDRKEIARYGLRVADVQDVLSVALGGMPLTTTVEGLQRYTINLRYDRDFRENVESLREIIVPTPGGAQVPLGQLADLEIVRGPDGHQKRRRGSECVDLCGRQRRGHRHLCTERPRTPWTMPSPKGAIQVPQGYNVLWSGQFEYMMRAQQRLLIVVPLTLLIIILIIYLNTKSLVKTSIVLLAVPFSLVGAFLAIAYPRLQPKRRRVGGIDRAGGSRCGNRRGDVALSRPRLRTMDQTRRAGCAKTTDLRDAIYEGAVKRVRPENMTAAVIIGRLVAHHVDPWRVRGCDETHRRTDDRRGHHFDVDGAAHGAIRRYIICGARAG